MFKSFHCFFSLLLSLLIVSCSGNENNKTAYGFEKDGKTFIKLKGKRKLAAHALNSALSNTTYKDSLILEVPSLQNSKVNGKDIPVRKGYYKYLGNLTIQGNKVQVNLSYDNTDDKVTEPTSWNGEYILVKN
jgi:hypothetical protein